MRGQDARAHTSATQIILVSEIYIMCTSFLQNKNTLAVNIHITELDTLRNLLSSYILANHKETDTDSHKAVTLAGKILAATEEIAEAVAG